MRSIENFKITEIVKRMAIQANCDLPKDVCQKIQACRVCEPWGPAKKILGQIEENFEIAREEGQAICQDTGMCCVFCEIGQDLHIEGPLEYAINEGVRQGYEEGYLRKSVVADPLNRVNTKDNTPAVIYTEIVPGDRLKITVAPKGFGSENMSQLKMLKPSDGIDGVKEFIFQVVKDAGPNPCPPIVIGVGLGGTFDKSALLAKQALMRKVNSHNKNPFYAKLEDEMLENVNALGIGPQGFGGKTTALGVNIEYCPTHIAGLPVAVNINCHVNRHITKVI
ncbi:MAG: fumarate hydratase [Eggerthellaceae bacterium]|nr:fumarate hydratase [Eggerthellaceae bacterium]